MKKWISVLLSMGLMASLAACGSSASSNAPVTAPSGPAPASSAAPSKTTAAERTLSIGFTTAPDDNDPYYVTCKEFKKAVEEKTNGRIGVEIYSGGQMGSELEMFEGMQTGILDMGIVTNAYVSAYVRSNGCLDLPFIFADLEQARTILDGEFGESLLTAMEGSGVTGLGWSEGGFRQLVTGKKAVANPDDLKGMKIRCMETKTYLSAYASLGVNATPMAWSETITALQQGTIDGLDIPISVIYTNGFPDVAKYIDMVNLYYSPLIVCISSSVLGEFSPEDQAILTQAARAAGVATRANNDATQEQMISEMEAQGMTIVTEIDTEAFRNMSKACYTEMEEYIGGTYVEDLMKLVGVS